MRRSVLALALTLAAVGGPLLAQDEPPLFEKPPAPEHPAPSPAPPAAPPGSPLGLQTSRLDFARWQAMTPGERQTYVEIAVGTIGALTERLRDEVARAKNMPREDLA